MFGHRLFTWALLCTIFLMANLEISSSESRTWASSEFVAECGYGLPPTFLCDPEYLLQDPDGNVTAQLLEVNNNTKGVINWEDEFYYGYVIAAAVVDTVEQEDEEDTEKSVRSFGEELQKAWFGGRVCDNATLVLVSLNMSQIFLFPGSCIDYRLRTHHKQVCADIRVEAENATEALMTCIDALDEIIVEALKPWTNAAWGYGGIVVVMTMLIFHYWIKY